jgi:ribosomal protein L11 methyltransferase
MNWLQLKIASTQANAEALSDLLFLLGSLSVTLKDAQNQPIYEPPLGTTPLWHEVWVTALFSIETDVEPIIQLVSQQIYQGQPPKYETQEILEQDWTQIWMAQSQPMSFGDRLWICPSHQKVEKENAVIVKLDPGLAFGTGSHPTTALCLNWLDNNIHEQETVIDYGCGSGILAIAALKLGAKQAIAIDNDPQALQACRENAKHNAVPNTKLIIAFPETIPTLTANILIANILANPLIDLAPQLAAMVKTHGKLVLSGILTHQIDAITNAYQSWFSFDEPVIQEDWVRLVGNKSKN